MFLYSFLVNTSSQYTTAKAPRLRGRVSRVALVQHLLQNTDHPYQFDSKSFNKTIINIFLPAFTKNL